MQYTSQIQHIPNSSYETLGKKYNNESNKIRFIAYQKALNPLVLNGHGKTNIIAVAIASDLIYATLNNRLDKNKYFKIRYKYYADEYGKSDQTIRRAVNLLRDKEIVEKEQRSYNYDNTHCANAIHLKLNVEKLLEATPALKSSLSKYSYKTEVSSYQNDTIILSKCRDVDNISNALKQDNLDAKSCESEVLNIAEDEKVSKETVQSFDESLDSSHTSDKICNLMKFHPVSQRVADEINKRAGRSFSMRFINMRIEKLNEKYKDSNKTVFKNEYGFISYMGKLFQGEKIQEFVANRIDFEFRERIKVEVPIAKDKTPDIKYEDIDQSTTLGKIQANCFRKHGEARYKSLFQRITTVSETQKELVIECGGKFASSYLKQHYTTDILSTCESFSHLSVNGTQLIISKKEELTIEKDLEQQELLDEAIKVDGTDTALITDSRILLTDSYLSYSKQSNSLSCNDIMTKQARVSCEDTNACENVILEAIETHNALSRPLVVKPLNTLFNFIKKMDYEEQKLKEYIEPQTKTDDEMLVEISRELHAK